jgi:hypothetical protein
LKKLQGKDDEVEKKTSESTSGTGSESNEKVTPPPP